MGLNHLLEGTGLDVLHHQPGAVLLPDDVVDGDHAGVVEPGGRASPSCPVA